ncbi:hypothetical protein SprV_0702315600 [Sparganum proliferum]
MPAGLLNRQRTPGIGCWNVRTFLDPGTQSLVAVSLYQHSVDVCRLSAVRLLDTGPREIRTLEVDSHFTLCRSAPRESSGRHDAATTLSRHANLDLLAWEPVNDQMAYVQLKVHFTIISIVYVGKHSTLSGCVRDVNGGFVADNSAKVEQWREHFEHHLNFDTQPISPLLSSAAEFPPPPIYAVPCDPPSEGEVADAIPKATQQQGTRRGRYTRCNLQVLCRHWRPGSMRNEVVPDDWGLDILVPILKEGCENYRGISLIDVTAKIFVIVILKRFQTVCDSRTRLNHAEFRAERGSADQALTLRRILEFHHSYQQPTAVCFADFAAAFDSVHRKSLRWIMALHDVLPKIIAMIRAYHHSTTARVLAHNNLSRPFGIPSGVRKGCNLSSILFNYAIDWIFERALHKDDGVQFAPGHRLTDLHYADDDLQSMV